MTAAKVRLVWKISNLSIKISHEYVLPTFSCSLKFSIFVVCSSFIFKR